MRIPQRTRITRSTRSHAVAAASLAGVLAVTGTAASASQAQQVTPARPAVTPPVATPTALPAAAAIAADAVSAPAFTLEDEAAAMRGARALLARKQAVLQVQIAKVRTLRSKVVDIAKDQVGDRYRTGSAGPDAFDCSGLVAYVYKKAMGKELPHQSRSQYAKVRKISKKEARPGDLVFFFNNGAHHVGVYIGGGKMVHAKGVGRGVGVSPISGSWYSRSYTGMGRVIAEPTAA